MDKLTPRHIRKVLCTRALPTALVQRAATRGIDLEVTEFITVHPLIPEPDQAFLEALSARDGAVIVFTSKHAVTTVADFLDGLGTPDAGPSWDIYCISRVTLEITRKRFPRSRIKGNGSYASGLAALILENKGIREVCFLCGNKRRDTLPDSLRAGGVSVREITVYETVLTPHQVSGSYDGILFFSPSGVESFFSSNRVTDPATHFFAIGRTTGEAIRTWSRNPLIVSGEQDAEVLISTVIDYYNKPEQTT